MTTENLTSEKFLGELSALLNKYDAELLVDDDGAGYGAQAGQATVTFNSKYDERGNHIREFEEIILPSWIG